jgi:hypothetical protein
LPGAVRAAFNITSGENKGRVGNPMAMRQKRAGPMRR